MIYRNRDYQNKVNNMINEGIAEGKYIETVDNTHKDLKRFQDFLYRNLYKHEHYENMRPKSNQPGRFFATTKTHKKDICFYIITIFTEMYFQRYFNSVLCFKNYVICTRIYFSFFSK